MASNNRSEDDFITWPVDERNWKEKLKDDATNVIVRHSVTFLPAQAFLGHGRLTELQFAEGVHTIGSFACGHCELLRTVIFPQTLREIHDLAFLGCSQLRTVTFQGGVVSIGRSAFNACHNLENISFPSTIKTIGSNAFSWSALTTVGLTMSKCSLLTQLEAQVFFRCNLLQYVALPPSIRTIGFESFGRCRRLTTVILPPHLESIQDSAFSFCPALVTLELPRTVTRLGRHAVQKCESMRNIQLPIPDYSDNQIDADHGLDALNEVFEADFSIEEALCERFANLPIHDLCYHQIHNPLAPTLRLEELMASDDALSVWEVDKLGMTPLHILALSAKPNLDMFSVLVKNQSISLIAKKDAWGKTCIEYALENNTPHPKPNLLVFAQEATVSLKLERWRTTVMTLMSDVGQDSPSEVLIGILPKAFAMLAKFEWKEMLTQLELSVWKSAMNDIAPSMSTASKEEEKGRKKPKLDRDAIRFGCGSDVVISNVWPFMDSINTTLR